MDGKGKTIDNIFIERFWRGINYEKIYIEPSDDGVELFWKIKGYLEFYNNKVYTSHWVIKSLNRYFPMPLRFVCKLSKEGEY